MLNPNVLVLSAPRSGSSALAETILSYGYRLGGGGNRPAESIVQNSYEFNPKGYFEDVGLSLLCDQIIRFRYGSRNSFLHTVGMDGEKTSFDAKDGHFDLTDGSVEIPTDYFENLEKYTGVNWDSWGLGRMGLGGKWHQAYSRYGCASQQQSDELWAKFCSIIIGSESVVAKDPRLLFLAPWLPAGTRVVLLSREKNALAQSMKRHYGPRLFSQETYSPFGWVSNHFNYRVAEQAEENYMGIRDYFHNYVLDSFPSIQISTESLADKVTERRLKSFLNR